MQKTESTCYTVRNQVQNRKGRFLVRTALLYIVLSLPTSLCSAKALKSCDLPLAPTLPTQPHHVRYDSYAGAEPECVRVFSYGGSRSSAVAKLVPITNSSTRGLFPWRHSYSGKFETLTFWSTWLMVVLWMGFICFHLERSVFYETNMCIFV